MSVLQQFTSNSGPPLAPPPPAATPAATSLPQQITEHAGMSLHPALLWHNQWRAFPEQAFTDPALRGSEESQATLFHSTGEPVLPEWIRIAKPQETRERATEWHFTFGGVSLQEGRLAGSTLGTLEQAYVLEDRSGTPAFIKRHGLLDLLLVAREPLSSAFGEGAVKKLTLVEYDEGFVTLFCFVMVPGDLDQARRALNSFDESWWLAHSHEAGGNLNFDFELI